MKHFEDWFAECVTALQRQNRPLFDADVVEQARKHRLVHESGLLTGEETRLCYNLGQAARKSQTTESACRNARPFYDQAFPVGERLQRENEYLLQQWENQLR